MLALELEREVTADRVEQFVEWMNRRAQGEPVAYIRGKKEFWSLDFYVDRRVLIPRPETELLIEQTLSLAKSEILNVADIGTGSGVLGIALAKEREGWNFVAVDSSKEALEVAAENAKRHGVADRIEFREGDLCAPLQDRRGDFDLIVANLPYVPRSDLGGLSVDVKDYEPLKALDGGEDGLELIFRLVQEARSCLRSEGWLLLEIGLGEASTVMDRMRQLGFREIHSRKDLQGIPRIVWGRNDGSIGD
jgi:release factor glutamine methyltransferase